MYAKYYYLIICIYLSINLISYNNYRKSILLLYLLEGHLKGTTLETLLLNDKLTFNLVKVEGG